MHLNLSLCCTKQYSDTLFKCDWKLVSEGDKRPAVCQGCYMSFLVPDGQNLKSSVLCVESVWVLLQYMCMWRDKKFEDGGKREEEEEEEDGLMNKCYSVLLWYSHYLPHRSGCAATACSPHRKQTVPFPFCQLFLRTSLSNWNIGIDWMEKHCDQAQIQIFASRSAGSTEWTPTWRDKGNWARMRDLWGCRPVTAKHQLAGKLTTNT